LQTHVQIGSHLVAGTVAELVAALHSAGLTDNNTVCAFRYAVNALIYEAGRLQQAVRLRDGFQQAADSLYAELRAAGVHPADIGRWTRLHEDAETFRAHTEALLDVLNRRTRTTDELVNSHVSLRHLVTEELPP
jgi:hypothetical protein